MAGNKKYYWLKLPQGYLDDARIKKLRRIAGGDTFTIIYLKMQLLSISNEGVINFENIENTFAEELSLKLDEDLDNVKVTLSFLSSQGLIEANDSSFLLTETTTRIGGETAVAERVRRFRAKNANKMLHCNTSVTNGNTDIDIEIEKEIEIDNTRTRETPKKTFQVPSVEAVREYCLERNNSVDAERFVDFYQSKGWQIGKNKMKDWKAAVRTWEKSTTETENSKSKYNSGRNFNDVNRAYYTDLANLDLEIKD